MKYDVVIVGSGAAGSSNGRDGGKHTILPCCCWGPGRITPDPANLPKRNPSSVARASRSRGFHSTTGPLRGTITEEQGTIHVARRAR